MYHLISDAVFIPGTWYPGLFSKVIAMDMHYFASGLLDVNPLVHYQHDNVSAFLTNNGTIMTENVKGTPCHDCRITSDATGVGAKTGWSCDE